jgi:hypothetical protein
MKLHRVMMKGKTKTSTRLEKKYKITPEIIDANKGFLGTKGKLLKALVKDKKNQISEINRFLTIYG